MHFSSNLEEEKLGEVNILPQTMHLVRTYNTDTVGLIKTLNLKIPGSSASQLLSCLFYRCQVQTIQYSVLSRSALDRSGPVYYSLCRN